jgi:hypothetical protein
VHGVHPFGFRAGGEKGAASRRLAYCTAGRGKFHPARRFFAHNSVVGAEIARPAFMLDRMEGAREGILPGWSPAYR